VILTLEEGNQGATLETKVACTCFTSYHVSQIANELESNTKLSPNFIKGWELQGEFGTRTKNGDFVQTALKSTKKNGLILKDGTVKKISGYATIKKSEIKQWLARGYAIVTSGTVTSTNFKKAKLEGVWGGNDGASVGGHAFCLVGYEGNTIWASNSYGPTWGFFKNGTFKIKEEDLDALGTCYIIYDEVEVNEADFIFKDVTVKSPMADAIKFCKEEGIFKGYDDGRFRPEEFLTRAQAAVLMQRIVQYMKK